MWNIKVIKYWLNLFPDTHLLPVGRPTRLGRRSGVGAGRDACFVPRSQSGLNFLSPSQRNNRFSGSGIDGQIENGPPHHHSTSPDPGCCECNARNNRDLRDAQPDHFLGTAAATTTSHQDLQGQAQLVGQAHNPSCPGRSSSSSSHPASV